MLVCTVGLAACGSSDEPTTVTCEPSSGAINIATGAYSVGSNLAYPEEGPSQTVEISDFWIASTEVTVGEFAKFVDATGYVTVAERPVDPTSLDGIAMTQEQRAFFLSPGGAVFDPEQSVAGGDLSWWVYTPGAYWERPQGPDKPKAGAQEPVTQVALEDAKAYARWAGGRLPSEDEWEVAASFGSSSDSAKTTAPVNANTWQGVFPLVNRESDGFVGVAPVGCFAPNSAGLYDIIGNVWEWTADPYTAQRGAGMEASMAEGTIKGGSYLCAPNYCMRYRPSARQAQETGLGTNHIGFRLVYDSDPALGR